MKKYLTLIVVIILPFICGCSSKLSTEELAKEVQKNIIDELPELRPDVEFTVIKDLILVKQNETEYKGVITLLENHIFESGITASHTYIVNVTYDGKSFIWKISQ